MLEEGQKDTLTFYLPRSHWRHIRSDGLLEKLFREVRRRTRASGAFPDLTSCLMLARARLKCTGKRRWEKRRYMDIDLLLEELVQRSQEVRQAGS